MEELSVGQLGIAAGRSRCERTVSEVLYTRGQRHHDMLQQGATAEYWMIVYIRARPVVYKKILMNLIMRMILFQSLGEIRGIRCAEHRPT